MDSGGYRIKRKLNLEIPIMIIIAGLMIVLMNFSDKKLNELIISDAEVLFMDIEHDPTDKMHDDLRKEISEFRPDLYKMIEVYDGQLNEIISINFADEDLKTNRLVDYPDLVRLLLDNEDGHTSRDINGATEYIYFKWSYDEQERPYLFIIYTYKPIVKYFWVFHLICYTILILMGILLIRLALKSNSDKIKLYNELTNFGSSSSYRL